MTEGETPLSPEEYAELKAGLDIQLLVDPYAQELKRGVTDALCSVGIDNAVSALRNGIEPWQYVYVNLMASDNPTTERMVTSVMEIAWAQERIVHEDTLALYEGGTDGLPD